jgi:hypothetical protein
MKMVGEQTGHIGADHAECRRRERELPGIAGQQVPRRRQQREIHGDDEDALPIFVAHDGGQKADQREHAQ